MNSKHAENNKRIAKNTGMLYIRMLFTMAVGLFTSRVILNVLGIEDYGIYNVVGGVISMFGFITGAMSSATSRYLTFEIGAKNTERLKRIFSLSISIHSIIALLILALGETIGLWFLNHKMQIPVARMDAAVWVFHCTVITAILSILVVPYNAALISHEKMTAFAYISIIDVLLKLFIVYLLWIIPFDKLKIYAILFVISQLVVQAIYMIYSRSKFEEARFRFIWDKMLFREMFSFASWNLIGNLAGVTYTQGVNILLNIYFGPAINAARGVAVQVRSIVNRFSSNFQTALNPQIVKSYATNDLKNMHTLIFASSKYSFFLLFFLSLPILIETDQILSWWLKIVPEHTTNFIRIIICISLIDALANPLIMAAQATGKIKIYQTVVGGILLLILPFAYVALKYGGNPESVFIVQIIVVIVAQIARLIMIRPMIQFSIAEYFKKVILKITVVSSVAVVIPLLSYSLLPQNVLSFSIICILSALSVVISMYFLGFSVTEKKIIKSKVKDFNIQKYIKRTK